MPIIAAAKRATDDGSGVGAAVTDPMSVALMNDDTVWQEGSAQKNSSLKIGIVPPASVMSAAVTITSIVLLIAPVTRNRLLGNWPPGAVSTGL